MVPITLKCHPCGSEKIVRAGRPPKGKQRSWWRDCDRRSGENPPPKGYREQAKESILNAYEERRARRGRARVLGVARPTVSVWLKKKRPPCQTCARRCLSQRQPIRQPPPWNATNGGHLGARKATNAGSGWRCVVPPAKGSPLSSVLVVQRLTARSGNGSPQLSERRSARPTFGKLLKASSRPSSLHLVAGSAVRRRRSNVGTTRFDSGWPLRQKNVVSLEVRSDAQEMLTAVSSSLQLISASHLASPLPKRQIANIKRQK